MRQAVEGKTRKGKSWSRWWMVTTYASPGKENVVAGWICGRPGCGNFVVTSNEGAYMAQRHMQSKHQVGLLPRSASPASNVRDESGGVASTPAPAPVVIAPFNSINPKVFQDVVLKWCVVDHVPFNKLDSPYFREVLTTANSALSGIALSSTSTKRWGLEVFLEEKHNTKTVLAASLSKIHLSFNIWSSPNN